MKVLILGASGMLGSAMMGLLASGDIDIHGTVRAAKPSFTSNPNIFIHENINANDFDSIKSIFIKVAPDIVINCIGIIKQLEDSYDPLVAIPLNSVLPHQLAKICVESRARLIHFSTDCVFSGRMGGYDEGDFPDANDLYGRSKYLGEVDYPGCVTLRTSIIGHELNSSNSLIDWFLSQEGAVKGYKNAIFSGLPTNEMARVIRDYVIPNPGLRGLYHVSVDPISKYDLLKLVSDVYGKIIEIIPDDSVKIDRSLNSKKFCEATGFKSKPWPQLIKEMYEFRQAKKG